MSISRLLLTTWTWNPSVLVGCAVLVTLYGLAWRRHAVAASETPRAALFVLGVLVLLFALLSPLDALGDTYLFSAHMAQHLLLIDAVAPLLLLGTPPAFFASLLRLRSAAAIEAVVGRPGVAWGIGVGALWLWHAPLLYEAALRNEGIHAIEHLSFLVTWTIFWWPLVAPVQRARRLPGLAPFGYLALAALANTVLGVIFTVVPPGLYPSYLHARDPLGILTQLRTDWGITPKVDQEAGGLLMWVSGGVVTLVALAGIFVRWFEESEAADSAGPDRTATNAATEEGARHCGVGSRGRGRADSRPERHPTLQGQGQETGVAGGSPRC